MLDTGITRGPSAFRRSTKTWSRSGIAPGRGAGDATTTPRKLKVRQSRRQRPRHARRGHHRRRVRFADRTVADGTVRSGMAPRLSAVRLQGAERPTARATTAGSSRRSTRSRTINDRAGVRWSIHGVNLSLGGEFDPERVRLRSHAAVPGIAPAVAPGRGRLSCRRQRGLSSCSRVRRRRHPGQSRSHRSATPPTSKRRSRSARSTRPIRTPTASRISPRAVRRRRPAQAGRRRAGERIMSARHDWKRNDKPEFKDDLLRRNERHEHGVAACIGPARRVPVAAARIHRLSGPGQIACCSAAASTSGAIRTCRALDCRISSRCWR